MDLEIEVAGEGMVLLPERAMFWPGAGTLFVADLHVGKAETFRRASIPIPPGSTTDTLNRLDGVLDRTAATRLIVLGDFFHAAPGRESSAWGAWRAGRSGLDVMNVRGNHDQHAGDPPPDWRITSVDEPYSLTPFALSHFPEPVEGHHVLAGHVHPAVRVRGSTRDSVRLPCFHLGRNVTVLPAFGAFTGSHAIAARLSDRVCAIVDGSVLDVSDLARGAF